MRTHLAVAVLSLGLVGCASKADNMRVEGQALATQTLSINRDLVRLVLRRDGCFL